MQQRVQIIHRRHQPSSAAQLPIAAALHAENLTLFDAYSTAHSQKSKPLFYLFQRKICRPHRRHIKILFYLLFLLLR